MNELKEGGGGSNAVQESGVKWRQPRQNKAIQTERSIVTIKKIINDENNQNPHQPT